MSLPVAKFATAGLAGLGFTLCAMPIFLAYMRRLGWGQEIRPEGPADHQSKAGTPTMGGGVLIPAAMLASLCAGLYSLDLAFFWFITLGCFLLGLVDDMTAITKKRNLGLKARHKLIIQGSLGLMTGLYLVLSRDNPGFWFPGLGRIEGWGWVMALALVVLTSSTNAVNLTDGLDGLAAGTVTSAMLAYGVICAHRGQVELATAALALVGALLGFLWFNCYPAKLFMGDTGSLGLGGALALLALLSDTPFLLMVIGGVFVAEAVSVILQVTYFKTTGGKRIFRMSPLHHHFSLGGLHEVQVTTRFWLVGALLGLLGVYLYFLIYVSF
ncbi:MAG: phospho-N-acetylmuramoyl-pentapeptide-transferase [Vulcanimicrobiota bacterium]